MKIIDCTNFKVYVYANDHPPPHCHVVLRDGSNISVDIPLIIPRYGETITKEVKEEIEDNIEELYSAWDKFNPNERQ